VQWGLFPLIWVGLGEGLKGGEEVSMVWYVKKLPLPVFWERRKSASPRSRVNRALEKGRGRERSVPDAAGKKNAKPGLNRRRSKASPFRWEGKVAKNGG